MEIEYIRQDDDLLSDPSFSQFADVFEFFTRPEELCAPREEVIIDFILFLTILFIFI